MTPLPIGFLDRPFAHRGLHGVGRPENSREAVEAAITQNYGIELDVQLTADGQAIVFHDDTLLRMTGKNALVRECTADEIEATKFLEGTSTPPRLHDILSKIGGAVPLLLEIKDQDGTLGPNIGPLETAVADCLRTYSGPVAVMSFNAHSIAVMADMLPKVSRGLISTEFDKEYPNVPEHRRKQRNQLTEYEACGCAFLSHDIQYPRSEAVAKVREHGGNVLCWTVQSPQQEARARPWADQITFEGYLP